MQKNWKIYNAKIYENNNYKVEDILKINSNSQKKAGEDLAHAQATGRIVGGTGALVAVEGDYQYTSKFNRNKGVIQPIMNKLRYKIVAKDAKK